MTIHLVTFSDESMSRSQALCHESASRHGVTNGMMYIPETVGKWREVKQNPFLFNERRGLGFWAWKPLIIIDYMKRVSEGQVLIYSDAGIQFINNVSHIIDRMGHDKPQDDIWLFGNNWQHHHWCKQSVIETIWPVRGIADVPTRMRIDCQRFDKQCQASVIFFRVSEYSRAFVAEWLKWCLWNNGELVDDSPSWIGNHPEFQEHRHDQAILTTMAYREGIRLHYWPATYNDGAFNYEKLPCYAEDNYPILFHHHRRRDHEWVQT
jgi:hypothetical protein